MTEPPEAHPDPVEPSASAAPDLSLGADAADAANAASPDGAAEPMSVAAFTPGRTRRGPLFDPGWLFLIAGVAIIIAAVLIPAQEDLAVARFYRDRILAIEQNRLERIKRYQMFDDALKQGDETLIRSLAATQLNKAPEGQSVVTDANGQTVPMARQTASVFGTLEPPPLVTPQRVVDRSTLEQWALDDHSRLWMMAAGGLCLFIGLLPSSTRR